MTIMNFKPDCCTLQKLLTNGIYKIPEYQRDYAWTDEQLERLWSDLEVSFNNYNSQKDNKYFFGSIVLAAESDEEGPYIVIDGQQRLTTFILMSNVILKKYYEDLKAKSDAQSEDITQEKVEACIKDNNTKRLTYQGKSQVMTDFQKILDDENLWARKTQKEIEKNGYIDAYKNTAKFFEEKFSLIEKKYEFIKYIYKKINLIRIVCDSEESAMVLFETINDTGLNLTHEDIIKMYFMQEYDKKQLNRQVIENDWKKLKNNLKNYIGFENFLMVFIYCYLCMRPDVSLRKTYKEEIIKKLNSTNTIDKVETELSSYSDTLIQAYNSGNQYVNSIRNLMSVAWSVYGASLIAQIWKNYNNNNNERDDLLCATRRFLYLALMSDYNISTIQQTLINILKMLKNKSNVQNITKVLDDFIKEKDMISRSNICLSNLAYGDKALKIILLSLEYKANTPYIELTSRIHADHILPKEYQKEPAWSHIVDHNRAESIINSLGNMALLESNKNISQKNFGFGVKQKLYNGNDENGQPIKSVTVFHESLNVANQNNNWDLDNIDDRKIQLEKKIKNMLNI